MCKDTGGVHPRTNLWNSEHGPDTRKKAASDAACGNFFAIQVSQILAQLFWSLSALRLWRCRSRACRLGRRSSGPGCGGPRRGRWHTGLRVVEVNHRPGNVHGRTGPKHWSIRPRIGSVDDHAVAVVRGVLHQHRTHLLQDALRDLVLLVLGIVTRVLYRALQRFLLLLDLLHQRAPGCRRSACRSGC